MYEISIGNKPLENRAETLQEVLQAVQEIVSNADTHVLVRNTLTDEVIINLTPRATCYKVYTTISYEKLKDLLRDYVERIEK